MAHHLFGSVYLKIDYCHLLFFWEIMRGEIVFSNCYGLAKLRQDIYRNPLLCFSCSPRTWSNNSRSDWLTDTRHSYYGTLTKLWPWKHQCYCVKYSQPWHFSNGTDSKCTFFNIYNFLTHLVVCLMLLCQEPMTRQNQQQQPKTSMTQQ